MKVLIEFENRPILFDQPKEIISCRQTEELPAAFAKMEQALQNGCYLAGFFSYEAGYAFETKLQLKREFDFPLLYFGVYNQPEMLWKPRCSVAGFRLFNLHLNISEDDYFTDIQQIRDHIAAGDVYQITYCLKYKFDFTGDDFALYKHLLKEQPVPYPAFIKTADFSILSLSPEMFMKKNNNRVVTKPMKGTWFRSSCWEFWNGWRLHFDPKNRAENIMICDLLRNDLGRIGSRVRAPKLFEVARYRTLYQMTSTVTARMDRDVSLHRLFTALHPSGSVTGAPKIRAMEIIRGLEGEERRIYTGAIGYITPDKDLFFNVPIRTLLIGAGSGEMGVGGGIVWDSTPAGELTECQLKAKFLLDAVG